MVDGFFCQNSAIICCNVIDVNINFSKMGLTLLQLPPEILEQILQYCNVYDLCRLRRCCKKLHYLASRQLFDTAKRKDLIPLVTNQLHETILKRSNIILSPLEKYAISHYWKIGKYQERVILKKRMKFMPWLVLDNEYLWVSQGYTITTFKRKQTKLENKTWNIFNGGQNKGDVCRFVSKDDIFISGYGNGGLFGWDLSNQDILLEYPNAHSSDVNAVAIGNGILASGSRDQTAKVWRIQSCDLDEESLPCLTFSFNDRVWSEAFNPSSSRLSVGTGANNGEKPFMIYDIERNVQLPVMNVTKPGAGILDQHWQTDDVLLTCGYDTSLRLWDLRVPDSAAQCTRAWFDPCDDTLYCLQTDGACSVVVGTQTHGRVVLWDLRQTKYVQMYFVQRQGKQSTPVYSIAFDSCVLFAAIDRSVSVLDFSDPKNCQSVDYSNVFND